MDTTKAKVMFARFKDSVNIAHYPTYHVPNQRQLDKINLYLDEHFLYVEVIESKPGLVMVPMSNISQIDLQVIQEEPDPKSKEPAPVPVAVVKPKAVRAPLKKAS